MNKRLRNRYKSNNRNVILYHIKENVNIYIVVLTMFLVGLFIGVTIINNLPDAHKQDIGEYINNSVNLLKNGSKLSKIKMLKQSIIKNIIIVFIIWILGLTFFGKYLLYLVVVVLGTTFGYLTSALMITFSLGKSLLFFLSSLLLQNLVTIPILIFLCVQGIKCHNDFLNKKGNYNINYMLIKYTSYAIFAILFLGLSSVIEAYLSGNLIYTIIKYL